MPLQGNKLSCLVNIVNMYRKYIEHNDDQHPHPPTPVPLLLYSPLPFFLYTPPPRPLKLCGMLELPHPSFHLLFFFFFLGGGGGGEGFGFVWCWLLEGGRGGGWVVLEKLWNITVLLYIQQIPTPHPFSLMFYLFHNLCVFGSNWACVSNCFWSITEAVSFNMCQRDNKVSSGCNGFTGAYTSTTQKTVKGTGKRHWNAMLYSTHQSIQPSASDLPSLASLPWLVVPQPQKLTDNCMFFCWCTKRNGRWDWLWCRQLWQWCAER